MKEKKERQDQLEEEEIIRTVDKTKKESCWNRRYFHGDVDIQRINCEERTDGNFDAVEKKGNPKGLED